MPKSQINFPLDQQARKTIERHIDRFVQDSIFDVLWDDFFLYLTFFEGTDGFDITGNVVIDGGGADVRTPASGSGTSTIQVSNSLLGTFSFANPSRMRSYVSFTEDDNQEGYLIMGTHTSTNDAYGFRINGNTLQGMAQTGSSNRTTVDLITISTSTLYAVDARFLPGNKVEFRVDGDVKGVVRDNLPVTAPSVLWTGHMIESEAVQKTMFISGIQYLQRRF